MSNMPASANVPLWTPQRLSERYDYWQAKVVTSSMAHVQLINDVVADYERELATLRAEVQRLQSELAASWQPVPDGEYVSSDGHHLRVGIVAGKRHDEYLLEITQRETGKSLSVVFPADRISFCRLAPAAQEAQ